MLILYPGNDPAGIFSVSFYRINQPIDIRLLVLQRYIFQKIHQLLVYFAVIITFDTK